MVRALLFLFLLSTPAYARIFLEPELGYEVGKYSKTITTLGVASTTTDNTAHGFDYGAKLGYRKHFLIVGGEYETSSLSGSLLTKDASAFAGFAFLHFRVWGSYIFSAKITDGSGSGYKVGLGTPLLFWLRLNGEYSVRNYNSYSGTALATGSTYGASLKSVKVTLSLPLNL